MKPPPKPPKGASSSDISSSDSVSSTKSNKSIPYKPSKPAKFVSQSWIPVEAAVESIKAAYSEVESSSPKADKTGPSIYLYDESGEQSDPSTPSPLQGRQVEEIKSDDTRIIAARHPRSLNDILCKKYEENNLIYHHLIYSTHWLVLAISLHIIQWGICLPIGKRLMDNFSFSVVTIIVIIIPVIMIYSRYLVIKGKVTRKALMEKERISPEDEADEIPTRATYILMFAAFLEGLILALFTAVTAGYYRNLDSNGYFTQNTITLTLSFSSITFLAFHRVMRPANRGDPIRTILELEIVGVCWDALDGSTLLLLINTPGFDSQTLISARVLMAFWYMAIAFRMAITFCNMLPPVERLYKVFLFQPLQLAVQPTVDRTMIGLRLKALIVLSMALPELYSAIFRVILWSKGLIDVVQQEMAIKNFLFLSAIYSAYSIRNSTIHRDWNSRDLGFGVLLPSRETQLRLFRWGFVSLYIFQGILLSIILILVTPSSSKYIWLLNVATDVILCCLFLLYCSRAHINRSSQSSWCCFPRESYINFPWKTAVGFSVVMMFNLYIARIPVIYYSYGNMAPVGLGMLHTYANALLIIDLGVLVIGCLAMYWSISYMLFKREFTACPGNYNAIHDPTIGMVALCIQIEGALDVLSCTSFMDLVSSGLSPSMNAAVVAFSLLELVNACQSFGLQSLLSGGHDDTPLDLVKWKSSLRFYRVIIDFGAFVLRLTLWLQYGAISSVFLIKNLYNLLHSYNQVERGQFISKYPKGTMFTEFVHPSDWYDMNKEEWRHATSNTILAQVQAGRVA